MVATSDRHRPRDYVVRIKIEGGCAQVSNASTRQPMSPWQNDNHSDVTEKRDREGADMRITDIFSLGDKDHGHHDRRRHDDGWRNQDYDYRNWRQDDWYDRDYDHRGNC